MGFAPSTVAEICEAGRNPQAVNYNEKEYYL